MTTTDDMGFKVIRGIRSLEMALETCRQEGVKFDRTYRVCIPDSRQASYGIHTYINLGDCLNVAWWTPALDCLAAYTAPGGGRQDGTPKYRRAFEEMADGKLSNP